MAEAYSGVAEKRLRLFGAGERGGNPQRFAELLAGVAHGNGLRAGDVEHLGGTFGEQKCTQRDLVDVTLPDAVEAALLEGNGLLRHHALCEIV